MVGETGEHRGRYPERFHDPAQVVIRVAQPTAARWASDHHHRGRRSARLPRHASGVRPVDAAPKSLVAPRDDTRRRNSRHLRPDELPLDLRIHVPDDGRSAEALARDAQGPCFTGAHRLPFGVEHTPTEGSASPLEHVVGLKTHLDDHVPGRIDLNPPSDPAHVALSNVAIVASKRLSRLLTFDRYDQLFRDIRPVGLARLNIGESLQFITPELANDAPIRLRTRLFDVRRRPVRAQLSARESTFSGARVSNRSAGRPDAAFKRSLPHNSIVEVGTGRTLCFSDRAWRCGPRRGRRSGRLSRRWWRRKTSLYLWERLPTAGKRHQRARTHDFPRRHNDHRPASGSADAVRIFPVAVPSGLCASS